MPTISVVMPVYNGASFLRQAIDSVLRQQFDDWELVVIDDGSTDSTPQILDTYQDPRIKIYRQENKGEAGARNSGLERATGKYTAFLDADDEYLPNALQSYINFLQQHPEYDVVYSDGYLIDQDGQRLSRLTEHRAGTMSGKILEPIVVSPMITAIPSCTLFKSEIIHPYHTRFDLTIGYSTDWDFWTQLALHYQFGYLDETTCLYRVHGSNMTRSATILKRKGDLIKGRLKVFHSDWFSSLSIDTRHRFLYYLVADLCSHLPEQQIEILKSRQVSELPVDIQARLWRLAGSSIIEHHRQLGLARECFTQAKQLSPNLKGDLLLMTTYLGRPLAWLVHYTWRGLARLGYRLKVMSGKTPKMMPQQLLPGKN